MTKAEFIDLKEKIKTATLPEILSQVFQLKEDLDQCIEEEGLEEFIPTILYFANDPYKEEINDEEYNTMVNHCKNLVDKIKFTKKGAYLQR